MAVKSLTQAEQLEQIAKWFERHKYDYDPFDVKMPPKVWSEHFNYLVHELRSAYERIEALETRVRFYERN